MKLSVLDGGESSPLRSLPTTTTLYCRHHKGSQAAAKRHEGSTIAIVLVCRHQGRQSGYEKSDASSSNSQQQQVSSSSR